MHPNASLAYAVETGPSGGALSGTAPDLTYTPNPGFTGQDSFTFTVNDGKYTSAEATVSITVWAAPAAPTGIAGVFQDACVAAGIPAVTFWAAVPHYVSQPPNPKATVALLRRVEDVLDIEVPLGDLPAQAEEWEQAITEMTADDEEIADYVTSLEQRGDAEIDVNEALSKVDGDALAAEFERYLRRRGGPGFTGP